jgi:hypothetical protein
MTQNNQLNISHLKNLIVLARHGIAAIGQQLPAHEGKAAYESLGAVEQFVLQFEQQQQQQFQQPQVPQDNSDIEIHTVRIE